MLRYRDSVLLWVPIWAFSLLAIPAAADEEPIDFVRQIRPLLTDKCFACHGPSKKDREGELRLDTKKGAFGVGESGEKAIVPGKPAESELYKRLVTTDKDEHMPPADSKKTLTPAQIELFKRWIAQGAKWQGHWSLIAPERPVPPKPADAAWPKNEIDRFVLARLKKAGLSPAEEASKTAILRRVTFDLAGLPPTIKEVDDFLADKSPKAYERVVDRLLASPHYGEHMARYWLDAARYADTHGLHLDNVRQIWPYRDWVINAFQSNMPFDQFSIEQIAGDLIPNATDQQKVATGFNRCNVTTSEGGAINEEYYVHYTVDRVATTSVVWMGLSMGCVRCHEHKFDPFDMKDFYRLFAFFNNLDGPIMDGNKPLPAPTLKFAAPKNKEKLDALTARITEIEKQRAGRAAATAAQFAAWNKAKRATAGAKPAVSSEGLYGYWPFEETGSAVTSAGGELPSGALKGATRGKGKAGKGLDIRGNKYADLGNVADFERDKPFSYGAWVNVRSGNRGSAILARMNDGKAYQGFDLYVSGDRLIAHLINSWPNNALKVETKQKIKINAWQHVMVTYDGSSKVAGVKIYLNGKSSPLKTHNNSLSGTIRTDVPLLVGRRSPGSPYNGLVDDVRIYTRTLSAGEVSVMAGEDQIRSILAVAPEKRTPAQTRVLKNHYLAAHDTKYQKLSAELAKVNQEKQGLAKQGAISTLVWRDRAKPKPAYILTRGDYDKKGKQVTPGTPVSLPPMKLTKGQTPTRLDLAKWLVSPEHPLTARVTVNRFWQQYFGVGIVETSEDFGSQGALPSHPQLLDWLAVDFRENGWNVQRLQKQIVMSATYRQSSRLKADMAKKDPGNRLLSRGPRFRLDAELIRDNALAISGLLVRTVGGPSVKPYQPIGVWKAVGYTDSNTANFRRDTGMKLYRRSMYTFWKRTAPPPSLVVFDAPSRENCTVRRSRTNTPLAALALMNDEQFVEAARHLAQRSMNDGGKTDAERATFAFRLATGRAPDSAESKVLLGLYKENLAKFQGNMEAATKLVNYGESKPPANLNAAQLAAWTMVANLILNLDETITKG